MFVKLSKACRLFTLCITSRRYIHAIVVLVIIAKLLPSLQEEKIQAASVPQVKEGKTTCGCCTIM